VPEPVVVTLPADQQQVDGTGYVWTFLDESPTLDSVYPGAVIVAGDAEDPFLARVVDVIDRPSGKKVHIEPIADPDQVIDEFRQTGPLPD
jgi:hypothetical protein